MANKILVAISGASGAIYPQLLLNKLLALKSQWEEVSVVMSNNAKEIWQAELGNDDFKKFPFNFYD
jgi:4-hydroxy-3-polyprenylbenzoate decarboxylase